MTEIKGGPKVHQATTPKPVSDVKKQDTLSAAEERRLKDSFKGLSPDDKQAAVQLVKQSGFENVATHLPDEAAPRKTWADEAEAGFKQAEQGGLKNTVVGYGKAAVASLLAGPGEAHQKLGDEGAAQMDKGGVVNTVVGGAKAAAASIAAGPSETHARTWDRIGTEGAARAQQGGVINSVVGNAQAAVASALKGPSMEGKEHFQKLGAEALAKGNNAEALAYALAAGVNDPGGEMRRDGADFQKHLKGGFDAWQKKHPGQKLSFDDPQRKNFDELKATWDNSGAAKFNDAPPNGDFPGGQVATGNVRSWLNEQLKGGRRIPVEALIERSLDENRGNVPLAMGSIAQILHDNRTAAVQIDGLRGEASSEKDYYRFAGAYAGLQGTRSEAAAGYAASLGNIFGNPLVYGGIGVVQGVIGKAQGDEAAAQKGFDMARSRAAVVPNYNKLHELNAGFMAGLALRPE